VSRPLLRAALLFAAVPAAVSAQGFNFPNFANTAGLTLNGSATQNGASLQLTDLVANQTGSVWVSTPQTVTNGFRTEFSFRINGNAEGFAFVLHGAADADLALGGSYWGLGYGNGLGVQGIPNSLAVEIDKRRQVFLSDTTTDEELSIHTLGTQPNSENEGASIARAESPVAFGPATVHTIAIDYVPGLIQVFVDGDPMPALSANYTLETGGPLLAGGNVGGLDLPTGQAWLGFTAATGNNAGLRTELLSWNHIERIPAPPCATGTVVDGGGAPFDALTVNGSPGDFFRTVRLQSGDPFSIGVVPPPGSATAPFLLAVSLGAVDGSSTLSLPGIGDLCFSGFDAFMPMVAPTTIDVPVGVRIDATFTLQAGMQPDPMQPGFALTNAVVVDIRPGPAPVITTFSPNSAPPGGTITISGANFSPFATVSVDGSTITPTNVTESSMQFAMPANVSCDAVLSVRNPDGSTATAPFTFNPTPVVTNVPFTSGTAAGGQNFVVVGTGLAPGSTVTFNGTTANVTTATSTVILATTPPGTPGPAQVVITTPGGCSTTTTYTYN
jgi:hypothetical protein